MTAADEMQAEIERLRAEVERLRVYHADDEPSWRHRALAAESALAETRASVSAARAEGYARAREEGMTAAIAVRESRGDPRSYATAELIHQRLRALTYSPAPTTTPAPCSEFCGHPGCPDHKDETAPAPTPPVPPESAAGVDIVFCAVHGRTAIRADEPRVCPKCPPSPAKEPRHDP